MPDDPAEQKALCDQYKPWGVGQIYLTAKVDNLTLLCWHRYDGCRYYGLKFIDNRWVQSNLVQTSCPTPA